MQTLIQNAAALGRPVSVAGRTQLLSNGTDDDLTAYYAIGGRAPVISDKFDEVSRGEVFQLLMGCRESDWPAILKGTSGAKIAAWWDRAVDIIPISGGKGAGIQKVLAYYGLTPEDAMAFGDGNNDIEMFQAVGHSVAMGNASADLKAIASEVCRPCAEDGIYHYCKRKWFDLRKQKEAAVFNLSVTASPCHLPYRGEALAWQKAQSLRQRLPSVGELSNEVRLRGCFYSDLLFLLFTFLLVPPFRPPAAGAVS